MTMRQTIIVNLRDRMAAYDDLILQTDDIALTEKLDVEKHKSLVEHLWCIIGARESYAGAIAAGQWNGFSCSLTEFTKAAVEKGLRQSANQLSATIEAIEHWSDEQEALLATVAEHEVMHEGQIIRHVLATGGTLPASWKWA